MCFVSLCVGRVGGKKGASLLAPPPPSKKTVDEILYIFLKEYTYKLNKSLEIWEGIGVTRIQLFTKTFYTRFQGTMPTWNMNKLDYDYTLHTHYYIHTLHGNATTKSGLLDFTGCQGCITSSIMQLIRVINLQS